MMAPMDANLKNAAPAPPRRWRHRLFHSLQWRLVALFLLLALGLSVAFVGGMQKSLAVGWRDAVRPLLVDYVDRLAAEIGSPPDIARAQALVQRLPISVRIEGPVAQFDSHPNRADEGRGPRRFSDDGEHGHDSANARLLLRTTADGHTLKFGLGDLNWRRGPGGFFWITLSALLLLTALAFAYVRRLLKPLDDIGAGARRFGAGDFAKPIVIRRQDELGDLAGQINTMGQDISHMLDAKRGLLLAISHELRSPLTRARLNTELLPDSPEARPQRDALLRDLAEMGRLITDLLESERLSGNHAALHLEPLDLAELVREVVAELSQLPQAEDSAGQGNAQPAQPAQSGKLFALDLQPGLPLINADKVRLRLLVRNVLDNALRHSPRPPGESPANAAQILPIEIKLRQQGDQLHLSMRDHGAGVAEDQLTQLTQAFYRTDAGRLRSTGGVGLGLYLCRLVVQAHGGQLALFNANPGLMVTATLPLSFPKGQRGQF